MKTCCLLLLALLAAIATASCGGNGAGIDLQPAGDDPVSIEDQAVAVTGLPDPASLGEPGRIVSSGEQGWFDVSLYQTYKSERSQGVEIDNGLLGFEAGNGTAWQFWGVGGFDSDVKPSAISAKVVDVIGEYYIGVADYKLGRWQFHGPFTESAGVDHDAAAATPALSNLLKDGSQHYVALIVPDGSSLKLETLSIGLAADGDSPVPPNVYCMPGEDYVMVRWQHSLDLEDLDFAGYSIERADLFSEEYATVSEELVTGTMWQDHTVEPGEFYRYRVRAHSLSGANAVSSSAVGGTEAGANCPPICKMTVTEGPFHGPSEVTIDLSGSYDPDGDPITVYRFNFGFGKAEVTQSTPILTTTLQPGSYNIFGAAGDSSTTSGFSYKTITVYPEWKSEPTVIEESSAYFPRVTLSSAGLHTQSGMLCTLYFDIATNNIAMLEDDGNGHAEVHQLFGPTGQLYTMSNACEFAGDIYWCVSDRNYRRSIVRWDGSELSIMETDLRKAFTVIYDQLIEFNGRLMLVYSRQRTTYFQMTVRDLFSGEDHIYDEEFRSPFKLAVDPAGEYLDFLVQDKSDEGLWFRLDRDFDLVDSESLPECLPKVADLAADPMSRDVFLVYKGSPKMEIRTLPDGSSSWSQPTISSILMLDGSKVQMFHRGGKLLLVLQDLFANVVLYEVSVGGITKLYNIADFVFMDEFWVTEGHEGMLRYVGLDYRPDAVAFVDVSADGKELAHEIPDTSLLGGQLQAAKGSNFLVVSYYRNNNAVHRSSYDGQTFNSGSTFAIGGHTQLTTDGSVVYIGNSKERQAEYARINGNQYILKLTENLHDDDARPLHGGNVYSNWYCQRSKTESYAFGSNG
ncbi:fibronectin type III domain-containing protein [bacterium]|nr:fibronectin type III domain-containing protein [bacterium]